LEENDIIHKNQRDAVIFYPERPFLDLAAFVIMGSFQTFAATGANGC
jgi:hypothetical protein